MHAAPLMNSGYPLGAGGPPPAQFGGPFGGPPPGAYGPPPGAGLMPPGAGLPGADPGAQDPAQLQQLVQLLGAKVLPKQTAVVECPKSMVGRVIGKGGETIKALQQYTGAMIQIDQSTDPTRVTIAGSPQSLQLAVSMVNDIVRGTFKGFAMLRQIAISTSQQAALGQYGQPQPVYVQGYGFVPPSQVYNPDEANLASLLRTSPTGPLTPPMTPLRLPGAPPGAAGLPGAAAGLPPEALAALLGQNPGALGSLAGVPGLAPQGMPGGPPGGPPPGQDALVAQLLSQLAAQQQGAGAGMPPPPAPAPSAVDASNPLAGADQGTIQALLAQAGLLGAGQPMGLPTGAAAGMSATALPPGAATGLPPSTSLLLSATGAPAVIAAAGGPGSTASAGEGHLPRSGPSSTASPPPGAPPAQPPASALSNLLQGGGGGGGAAAAGDSAPGSHLGTSPPTAGSTPRTGSGRNSPAVLSSMAAAANPALSRRSAGSDGGSPMGRYGPVGSGRASGDAGPGGAAVGAILAPAAEEALASQLAAFSTTDAAAPPASGSLPAQAAA